MSKSFLLLAAVIAVALAPSGSAEGNALQWATDFPVNCWPGNSAKNGGVGISGYQERAIPYSISSYKIFADRVVVNISKKTRCSHVAPKTGKTPASCCDMQIDSFKFVVGNKCHAAITNITIAGEMHPLFPSFKNSSFINPYPGNQPWRMVVTVSGLRKYDAPIITLTIFPKAPCATSEELLPPTAFLPMADYSIMYHAIYGGTNMNCCGSGAY